jgi:hypothetical protein
MQSLSAKCLHVVCPAKDCKQYRFSSAVVAAALPSLNSLAAAVRGIAQGCNQALVHTLCKTVVDAMA